MHRPNTRTPALLLPFLLVAAPVFAGPLDDLQPGHWYEAPNSKLDSVAANLPGTTAVINAWNGGAYDTVNDRLIVWGGGHSDYSGNEIYVFDIATLRWTRWNQPSANTSCDFSVNEYPDGAPCAMHTYEYVDFHPGSQSFVILGGASPYPQGGGGAPTVHMYSFDTNAWRRGADRTGGSTLQGATSAYDATRDVFWVLGSYDQKFAKFDPDANGGNGAWTQYSSVNIEIDAASAIDPVRDLFVTVDGRGTHRVRVHALASPSAAPISVTTTGDKAAEQTSQIGFEWDPVSEKFVAWFGGTSVYTLTPPASNWQTANWVWAQVAAAAGNTVTPTAENPNGTYSRWRYVPSKNVFVVVNRTGDNVFFYKLSEGGGGGPSMQIGANPTTVVSGGSSTLTWSSADATSCTASGSWSGSKSLSGSQVMSNITTNKTYVLSCTGPGGTAQDSASVTVTLPAPTVTLTAAPTSVVSGGSSTLTWSSTNAPSCTASGDWSGTKGTSGNQVMGNLTANRHYVLTCTGAGGSGNDSADVTVTASAPTVNLTAAPTSVVSGGSSTLTWSSTNATSCTASGDWSDSKATSGNQVMSNLTANRHYVLTCTGASGSGNDSADVTVTAAAPTVTLTAAPTSVAYNGSSTLTWSSTNATSCTASGDWSGNKATSGNQVMSGLTENRHYVLTCTGAGGSDNDDASVTVGPPPAPTVSLQAAPTSVGYADSSTLTWSSTNATSCTASGDWSGNKATSGNQVMSGLTENRHYVLTCTGAGGSGNDDASVTVGPPPPGVDLTASPDSVDFADSTTLAWSSTAAELCVASGDWSGARAPEGQEVIAGLEADSTFSLTCFGDGGQITDTATVDVGAAPPQQPVVSLAADPSAVDYLGTTTITWSSINATSCVASGSWSGARALAGSEGHGPLSADSVFTLSCTGLGGTAVRSVTVDVALPSEPPTLALTATLPAVPQGGSATLTWSSSHADGCVASGGWSGARPPDGSASTGALTADTLFRLSCTGSGGTIEKSVTVDVQDDPLPAPEVTFSATPSSIDYGDTSVLTWTADHALWCTASGAWGGVKAPSGSETTTELWADSSFMLSCFNESGRTNESIVVSVAPPGDLRPVVSLSADVTRVEYHGTPRLTWSATNADTCVASGGWSGARPPAGFELLEPQEVSSSYALRCVNGAGEAEAVVSIAVGPPVDDPWIELSASPAQVEYRGDTQLAWATANVDSCTASGAWSGGRPSNGSELVVGLISDSAFMLSCSGPAGIVTQSVTVTVGEPGAPTLKLTAEPDEAPYGGTSVLSWIGGHLDVCVASGDWAGERAPNGIESVGPLTDESEFRLDCSGPGGSVSAAEIVDVSQPSSDDGDGDGLIDAWELLYFGDLARDGRADADDDGLSDGDEHDERTDPTRVDTDGDGAGDGEEVYYGSDPRDSGDVWTTHRPQRPEVDDSQVLELLDGVIETVAPYFDPDGNGLAYSDWQLGTSASFEVIALDRAVLGSATLDVPAGVVERSTTYWARTRHTDTTGLPSEWSDAKEISTAAAFPNDADGDDVDDDYQVEGFADTNSDGVDDDAQGLCNLYDAEGRSVIGFGANAGRIRCFTSIENRDLPDGSLYDDQLQYGMFSFSIDGLRVDPDAPATVRVTVYLPEAPTALSGWYKFDKANGEITDFSAYSSISGTRMLLNLVDGGAGDQDGVVNGVIVDPSGPAIAAVQPPPPPPPDDGGGDPPDPPAGDDGGGGGGAMSPLALLVLWRSLMRRRRSGATARE